MTVTAVIALSLTGLRAYQQEQGSPLFGLLVLIVCVGIVAVVSARRQSHRGAGRRWPMSIRSLALAAVLIGLPDVAFVAYYWCRSGGRWHVVALVDGVPELNRGAILEGLMVALGVAFLLRLTFWSSDPHRAVRIASLLTATSILMLLLMGAWLVPRRADYLARAVSHETLEGIYGGASWAIPSPEFPRDEKKAAHHRRLKEQYEYAARHPWLAVAPESVAP
ncbi:MAG: hypothetical protein U0835_23705 [Isosphaeraceae bacterium]